jgi:uncharacterized protein involved in exopolysaccharide biosynthesis
LEVEMQKLLLARNSTEYAYRIVDEADVPKRPVRPSRALAAVIGWVLGGVIAVAVLVIRNVRSN